MNELASSVLVSGYNGVALEGDSVSFTCSFGLVLTGPNSSVEHARGTENGNQIPGDQLAIKIIIIIIFVGHCLIINPYLVCIV